MTTIVRSAGDRTLKVCRFLVKANKAELSIRLAELEHALLKKMSQFCSGGVQFMFTSFYRDAGNLTRDG